VSPLVLAAIVGQSFCHRADLTVRAGAVQAEKEDLKINKRILQQEQEQEQEQEQHTCTHARTHSVIMVKTYFL
jgi:hypothetical protein